MSEEIEGTNIDFDDGDITDEIDYEDYGVLDLNGNLDKAIECLEFFYEYLIPEHQPEWILLACEIIKEENMVSEYLVFYVECIRRYYESDISEVSFYKRRNEFYECCKMSCRSLLHEEWVVCILIKDPNGYGSYGQAQVDLIDGMTICFKYFVAKGCSVDYLLAKLQARFPKAEVAV